MQRSMGLIAALFTLAVLAPAAQAVPVTTTFTGRVSDSGGPIDGSVNLTFRIYDDPSAGVMQWEEVHTGVTATNGLVFVELGSAMGNGLDSAVFTGANMYLELTINGAPQSPRIPITSVPYAVRAATADTLGTLTPSDVALSTHNHDGDYAAAGHNHDSSYALSSHNHDSSYAAASHDHAGTYALSTHNHDSSYAAATHNHDGSYSLSTHNHDGAYSLTTHNHSGVYALWSHTHSTADITSGTLSTARYSAYADLVAEGRWNDHLSVINPTASGDYNFTTSKTGYFVVAGSAFASRDSTYNYYKNIGYVRPVSPSTSFYGSAVIDLPNGAVVNLVITRYYDNGADDANFGCYLIRQAFNSTTNEVIANPVLGSSSLSGFVRQSTQAVSGAEATIDKTSYRYILTLSMTAAEDTTDLRHYGCVVRYTYDKLNH